MAKHAGLPWDAVLGAEIARAYKPRPEVYLESVAALGLQPAEATMVAAHENDLQAAGALGLGTAYVARPREHGAPRDAAPQGDYDHVATDLSDLASKLDA